MRASSIASAERKRQWFAATRPPAVLARVGDKRLFTPPTGERNKGDCYWAKNDKAGSTPSGLASREIISRFPPLRRFPQAASLHIIIMSYTDAK